MNNVDKVDKVDKRNVIICKIRGKYDETLIFMDLHRKNTILVE
jgi:hypothetical protein